MTDSTTYVRVGQPLVRSKIDNPEQIIEKIPIRIIPPRSTNQSDKSFLEESYKTPAEINISVDHTFTINVNKRQVSSNCNSSIKAPSNKPISHNISSNSITDKEIESYKDHAKKLLNSKFKPWESQISSKVLIVEESQKKKLNSSNSSSKHNTSGRKTRSQKTVSLSGKQRIRRKSDTNVTNTSFQDHSQLEFVEPIDISSTSSVKPKIDINYNVTCTENSILDSIFLIGPSHTSSRHESNNVDTKLDVQDDKQTVKSNTDLTSNGVCYG